MYIEILDDNKLKTPYNIVLEHEYEHVKIIKKIWNKFAKTANEIKEESAIICCKCINASKKYIEVLRNACDVEIKYEDAKLEEEDHSATPHNVPATQSNFLLAKKECK